VFWDLNRVNPERAGVYITGRSVSGARMRAFWPCKDGWINFIVYGGSAGRHTNQQLVAWMEERGMGADALRRIDWRRFTVPELTQEQVDAIEAPIGAFLATLTKQEFLEEAMARQMLGYPVSSAEDIHRDSQLEITAPRLMRVNPMMVRRSVDLPTPLRPSTARLRPCGTPSVMP